MTKEKEQTSGKLKLADGKVREDERDESALVVLDDEREREVLLCLQCHLTHSLNQSVTHKKEKEKREKGRKKKREKTVAPQLSTAKSASSMLLTFSRTRDAFLALVEAWA